VTSRKYYQTKTFREQEREWNARLAASGFRDIEVRDRQGRDTGMLNGMSTGDLQRGLYDPAIQRYYELCRAHTHRIERRLRAASSRPDSGRLVQVLAVWSLHAEGLRPPAIRRQTGVPRTEVKRIIAHEEVLMRRAEERADRAEEGQLTDE
jgi:hypothetical protein